MCASLKTLLPCSKSLGQSWRPNCYQWLTTNWTMYTNIDRLLPLVALGCVIPPNYIFLFTHNTWLIDKSRILDISKRIAILERFYKDFHTSYLQIGIFFQAWYLITTPLTVCAIYIPLAWLAYQSYNKGSGVLLKYCSFFSPWYWNIFTIGNPISIPGQ